MSWCHQFLTIVYFGMIFRIVVAGFTKYRTLALPLRFLYWSAVLDFMAESIGLVIHYFKGSNSEVFLVYYISYFTLSLLFFNFSNPKFQFHIAKQYWILLPFLLILLFFLSTPNYFQLNWVIEVAINGVVFVLALYSIFISLKQAHPNRVYLGFYILMAITSVYDFAVDALCKLLIYIYKVQNPIDYAIGQTLYLLVVYYVYYRLLFGLQPKTKTQHIHD